MINISTTFVISNTGQYHLSQNEPNQDHVIALKKGDIMVSVLADGASSFEAGGIAAQLLVPEIAEWLSSTFLEQYYCDSVTVRMRLVCLINNLFRTYAEEHNLDPRDLACTLIAVAVDSLGRGITLHLGDGIILRQRDSDLHCSVISSPENGLTPNATYLTMNCNMFERCRFYRLQESDPFRLIAMTDGAAECLVERSGKEGWIFTAHCSWGADQLSEYLENQEPVDDYSIAVLECYPQHCNSQ